MSDTQKNMPQALTGDELDEVSGGLLLDRELTPFPCRKCGRIVKMKVSDQIRQEYQALGFVCTRCMEIPSELLPHTN